MYNSNLTFYFSRTDSADFNIPIHTHKCYELVYYFSGSGHCRIDGEKFYYQKNSFVIIPPNAKHNDVHEEQCRLTCLGFSLGLEDGVIPAKAHIDADKTVGALIKLIATEFKDKKAEFLTVIDALINCIVVHALRKTEPIERSLMRPDVLEQALTYINEYFLTDISPEQLANLTNYSYHHFRHIFKDSLGISLKQYVIKKRLDHAKKLLANSTLSVTEIGYQCGFSSTSLFVKLFHKNADVTPAKYRAQLHSNSCFSDDQSTYEDKKD